jgi:hypothetical protein
MNLVKDGIMTREWVPPDDAIDRDGYYEETVIIPETAEQFFSFWHRPLLSIEAGYTLGDLVNLLGAQTAETAMLLSALCHLNLPAFLEEALLTPSPRDPEDGMEYLRVSNGTDLDHYVPDPNRPDEDMKFLSEEEAEEDDRQQEAIENLTGSKKAMRLVDSTSDDPITGKPKSRRLKLGAMFGTWVGPYHLTRDFSGWGKWGEPYPGAIEKEGWDPEHRGGISVTGTKLCDLLVYELKYEPKIDFWSGGTHDNPLGTQLFECELGITFGEFVHAILWEIGFYGEPQSRDEHMEEINERSRILKEIHGDEE